jgi:hypothetical protein
MELRAHSDTKTNKKQPAINIWNRLLLNLLLVFISSLILGIGLDIFIYLVAPQFQRDRFFSDGEFIFFPFSAVACATVVFGIYLMIRWFLIRKLERYRHFLVNDDGNVVESQRNDDLPAALENRLSLKPSEVLLADRFEVIESIHRRVERLTVRTQIILYTIGVALVVSAFIILFAGRLTSIDASAVSNVDRLKSDLVDENHKLAKLYKFQNLYTRLGLAQKSSDTSEVTVLQRQINFLSDDSTSPVDLDSTNLLIADEKKQIENIEALLAIAWGRELYSERGYSDWHYIAATAITRVGIVLIIVYLVQILMGLYRYNTRLIAYYNSRRDLLTLWDGKQRTLRSLDDVLTSSKIDFGKEPKHPLEDLFRALGGKMNSLLSDKGQKIAKITN